MNTQTLVLLTLILSMLAVVLSIAAVMIACGVTLHGLLRALWDIATVPSDPNIRRLPG